MKSVRSDRRRDGRGPGFVYCVLVMALMLDELAARMQVSRCCAHLVTNREGALRLIGIIQQFRMMHLQVQPLGALEASHDFRFGEEWHGHTPIWWAPDRSVCQTSILPVRAFRV